EGILGKVVQYSDLLRWHYKRGRLNITEASFFIFSIFSSAKNDTRKSTPKIHRDHAEICNLFKLIISLKSFTGLGLQRFAVLKSGTYWTRTSDPYSVKVVL